MSVRIISMVPSWTESLLACGFEVVGRTRYCIEPKELVSGIPVVGGTKDWNLDLIKDLKPDLVVLDKEENPKYMSEEPGINWVATHVVDLISASLGFKVLKHAIEDVMIKKIQYEKSVDVKTTAAMKKWNEYGDRWHEVSSVSLKETSSRSGVAIDLDHLPGLMGWINKPKDYSEIKTIVYVIWRNPWIMASRNTFIGSVASRLGLEIASPEITNNETAQSEAEKYPKIDILQFDPKETLLLFSSEPYPFHKKADELLSLGYYGALIDGQSFSWFGVRSLLFLESEIKKREHFDS